MKADNFDSRAGKRYLIEPWRRLLRAHQGKRLAIHISNSLILEKILSLSILSVVTSIYVISYCRVR